MLKDLTEEDAEMSAEGYTGKLIIQIEVDYHNGLKKGLEWVLQRRRRGKMAA